MAMTKAERDALLHSVAQLNAARALAWPSFPRPTPLPASKGVVAGWTVNLHVAINHGPGGAVRRGWQEGVIHYTSEPKRGDRTTYGSRDQPPMYATEAEACRELAYQLAGRFGGTMAAVYARCYATPEVRGEGGGA